MPIIVRFLFADGDFDGFMNLMINHSVASSRMIGMELVWDPKVDLGNSQGAQFSAFI